MDKKTLPVGPTPTDGSAPDPFYRQVLCA